MTEDIYEDLKYLRKLGGWVRGTNCSVEVILRVFLCNLKSSFFFWSSLFTYSLALSSLWNLKFPNQGLNQGHGSESAEF